MAHQTDSAAHFRGVYYQRGLNDGWAGKVYEPPRYNQQDRAAYWKGFKDAREDKHGV